MIQELLYEGIWYFQLHSNKRPIRNRQPNKRRLHVMAINVSKHLACETDPRCGVSARLDFQNWLCTKLEKGLARKTVSGDLPATLGCLNSFVQFLNKKFPLVQKCHGNSNYFDSRAKIPSLCNMAGVLPGSFARI